ncbi:hypothetical protein V6N13_002907 [Hibiscus sabdariffa]|uniref:Uncharacterized protein n=2 Tax=Hibiscus sabdariffa TaxID=183260 RepID=A0ABR2NYA6_9ROSI
MPIKIFLQLYGAFIMLLVLQSFVVESSSDVIVRSVSGEVIWGANYTIYIGKTPLTYGFESTSPMPSGLNPEDVTSVMDAAFQKWQDAVPEFAFQRVYPGENADIKISFTTLSNDLYGYGYYPPDGRLHLDIDHSYWSTKSYPAQNENDLLSCAMHEIGHTLGLHHTNDQSAVMYPTLYIADIKRELNQEDIDRIQSLYYY